MRRPATEGHNGFGSVVVVVVVGGKGLFTVSGASSISGIAFISCTKWNYVTETCVRS